MGGKNKAGSGIVIGGGTFSGSAFAAGPKAKASVRNDDRSLKRARTAVVDLKREIEDLAGEVPVEDAEVAAADVAEVDQALQDPPDRDRALSAMTRITATLGGVAGLATAVGTLKDALVRLFG
jgi:Family of unknown function (DUF5955)